ncbi:hypothetical protein RIF29_15082 [Crotalaria pallida]|uniref:Uncharacterized protein n=1 Tax=Crotalaria pallida TaxID=3830 RepID=A0AAN9ICA7_CROPI
MKGVGCDLPRFRAAIHATVMVAGLAPRSSLVAMDGLNLRFEKEKRTTEAKAMAAAAVRESLPTSKVASMVKGEREQGHIFWNDDKGAIFWNDDEGAIYGNDDKGAMFGNDDEGAIFGNDDEGVIFGAVCPCGDNGGHKYCSVHDLPLLTAETGFANLFQENVNTEAEMTQ